MSEKNLRALLDAEAKNTVDLCRKLIQIPSEDPPGDTREIAKFIDGLFRDAGIESEIVSPHPEKPSVVATVMGGKPGKHVVYNGHIDTFPVGDRTKWTKDPFGGETEGGKMYGRGSADMKGGLAASIMSVLLLNKVRDELPGRVSITCVSDEEVFGPWGSRYLLKERPELRGDALINGEPSSLEHLRIGEKGKHRFRIKVKTAGGHGAYAGLRDNAIERMMLIIQRIKAFETDDGFKVSESMKEIMERSRKVYDKILGPGSMDAALKTTMNIGTISGGIMVNLVAENCQAELDFRLPPGVGVDCLKSWIERQTADFPGAEIETLSSAEPFLTMPDHPLIKIAKGAAEEVCGFPVFENYSLGGTEVYLWRAVGTPGVTYGPSHHNMGSPDEYVLIDELPLVTKVQALTAWRYLHENV